MSNKELETLKAERKKIVSHATMGMTDGENLSINDIMLIITNIKNEFYARVKSKDISQIHNTSEPLSSDINNLQTEIMCLKIVRDMLGSFWANSEAKYKEIELYVKNLETELIKAHTVGSNLTTLFGKPFSYWLELEKENKNLKTTVERFRSQTTHFMED